MSRVKLLKKWENASVYTQPLMKRKATSKKYKSESKRSKAHMLKWKDWDLKIVLRWDVMYCLYFTEGWNLRHWNE